ncbi:MAG: choice-of-anchor D domain-containing protein [Acidobacteriota bacterium]|nr:choice-of-anchor D domain-containing protein [Acidobacteriota bacterium]
MTGTPANAAGSGSTSNAAQLTPSSAAISFGNVAVGSSTSNLVTLTVAGSSSVTISSSTASGAGFNASGPSNMTLAPGQSVNVSVSFQPKAAGNVTGTLLISSNASNSSLQITLSGAGVASTGNHSVSLNWQPSTTAVTGYFVFRGSSIGTLAQLNSSAVASTSYVDKTVVSGSTYVYAVRSLDASNILSNFSNAVTVTVPIP